MRARHLVSEKEVQNNKALTGEQMPELWTQLTPGLKRQLAQQWAKLIQQVQQSNESGREGRDVQD